MACKRIVGCDFWVKAIFGLFPAFGRFMLMIMMIMMTLLLRKCHINYPHTIYNKLQVVISLKHNHQPRNVNVELQKKLRRFSYWLHTPSVTLFCHFANGYQFKRASKRVASFVGKRNVLIEEVRFKSPYRGGRLKFV